MLFIFLSIKPANFKTPSYVSGEGQGGSNALSTESLLV